MKGTFAGLYSHKPTNLPVEKRSTDSICRKNVQKESSSNGKLIVSLEKPALSKF